MPDHDRPQQPSPARTPLALQRAKHALEAVDSLQGADIGKYVSYVKGLPANILRSGLGQAMAMEKAGAKTDKGHGILYAHIDNWLTADRPNAPYRNRTGQLLHAIVNNDQDKYLRAQAEALAYLEWLKKFAVAFLGEDSTQEAAAPSEPTDMMETPS
jgi:CRISPR-associated protein Cmr5